MTISREGAVVRPCFLLSLVSNMVDLWVSQNKGTLFGGPHNKGYNILGSILGSP